MTGTIDKPRCTNGSLRDRDASDNSGAGVEAGTSAGGTSGGMQDHLFNVVAIADNDGDVVKRMGHSVYGLLTEYDPDFTSYTGADYAWEHGYRGLRMSLATGEIDNRTRSYWPHLGRFGGPDWKGYVDGPNDRAGYFAMWGGVDPMGQLIIFVHGINQTNREDIHDVYEEFLTLAGNSDSQALIRFEYSWNNRMTGTGSAKSGIDDDINKAAGRELANLIEHLKNEKARIKKEHGDACDEPIYVMAYSNGSNVLQIAMNNGARVDGTVIVGGSLSDNAGVFDPIARNGGVITNYWSGSDETTELVDGIGSDGLKQTYFTVEDVEVSFVTHTEGYKWNLGLTLNSADSRRIPAGVRGTGGPYTTWLTRYMARTHYNQKIGDGGDLSLSTHGRLPGGTELAVNQAFSFRADVRGDWNLQNNTG